jgi:hypothetical protein
MTEQEQSFITRALAIQLPPRIECDLIIRGAKEGWDGKQLGIQRNRAKFLYFLEGQLEPLEEEIRMLRDGEDCEC